MLELTAPAFRLLVRAGRLRTEARIRYAQPDGTTAETTGAITLIAPRRNVRSHA
jgi:hypothetical protein